MAHRLRKGVSLVIRLLRKRSGAVATWSARLLLAVLMLSSVPALGADSIGRPLGSSFHTEDEAALIAALADIRAHRLGQATSRLERLLKRNPEFRLAYLVYGDLLLARAGPLGKAGGVPAADAIAVEELLLEARKRYDHHLNPAPADRLPASLIQLSGGQRHAVVVELDRSRLYLFEQADGRTRLVADYYAGAGKNGAEKRVEGDKKTPIGVYRVSGHIDGSQLPDLYGAGALPIDYPNAWDRLQGYTGSGIWLHGVPWDTYARSPLSSDGCVTMANADFLALRSRVGDSDVPVIIERTINWLPPAEIEARRAAITAALERWQLDRTSQDLQRYATHFSQAFRAPADPAAKVALAQSGSAPVGFPEPGIRNLSMFAYPGLPGTVVVSFDQEIRRDNARDRIRHQQFWRLEDDQVWRIIYEGES